MILATEQTNNEVKISYIDNNERKFLNVPKNNFWSWSRTTKAKGDSSTFAYDGDFVKRTNCKAGQFDINKYSIWEWINSPDNEHKDVLYKLFFPKMLFCDIETEVIDGFPDPKYAREAITTISFAYLDDSGKIQSVTFGYKENFLYEKQKSMGTFVRDYFHNVNTTREVVFKYKQVKDENQLLEVFIKLCSKFHILTGWFFEDFDWPYLKNRMTNLGIDYSAMSPTGTLNRKQDPNHFIIIDYMAVFQKNDRTVAVKESMSLEFISKAVLGVGKLKYSGSLQEMYEKDYEKYVLYNAIDTINVLLIHDTCKTLNALLALANISACEVSKCQSPVNITEGLMSKAYLDEGRVIPKKPSLSKEEKQRLEEERGEYEGAYVRVPILGMHEAVVCYDFSSLYPSIARQLNLSPESFIGKQTPDFAKMHGKEGSFDRYKPISVEIDRSDKSKIFSVTGCEFDKKESTLKKIFDGLYSSRKTDQSRFKTCDKLAHELKQRLKK